MQEHWSERIFSKKTYNNTFTKKEEGANNSSLLPLLYKTYGIFF